MLSQHARGANHEHIVLSWVMAMARNAVQFQKGLNEPEFERYYGNEEQCRDRRVAMAWRF